MANSCRVNTSFTVSLLRFAIASLLVIVFSVQRANASSFIVEHFLHTAELTHHCTKNDTVGCIINTNCSVLRVERNGSDICTVLLLPPPNSTFFDKSSHFPNGHRPTAAQVWGFGGLSVAIISLSGIFGAVLWPVFNSPYYPHVMRVLLGLAVGSLSSTAVLQLIPEGFNLKEHDPTSQYLKTATYTWFSFWLLFSIEALTKIIFKGQKKGEKVAANTSNGHTCGAMCDIKDFELNTLLATSPTSTTKRPSLAETGHKIAAVAWIIIFGDGLHNFIDGMSIGAGYTQSIGTGISISIAIACEEFPHELGDFAILIQSGMSLKKAMLCNFLSACTSFVGLALGIVLGELEGAHYIFAFAGGLFLYVSLTHLIPELKDMLKEALRKSRLEGFVAFLLQNVGILTGSILLYFITLYNDRLTIEYGDNI